MRTRRAGTDWHPGEGGERSGRTKAGCSGPGDSMAAVLDRLREAAEAHDGS